MLSDLQSSSPQKVANEEDEGYPLEIQDASDRPEMKCRKKKKRNRFPAGTVLETSQGICSDYPGTAFFDIIDSDSRLGRRAVASKNSALNQGGVYLKIDDALLCFVLQV
jgi:hypothetical protein